ncbi:hypothetical protein niasHT_011843 [Heterodera trifolii]|uniref:Serpin domain-containing protein n=1 Tax=Heterodera trifolii TaxID=157864 RepID=A0ABD2KU53_9BILA
MPPRQVNEKGTEAAAATAVLIMAGSFIRPPPPQFVADRPFVAFLVNHSQTVNEKGTEAAAATAVLIMNYSFEIKPPPPQFVADRPFVAFLVNHSQTVNEKGTEASAATANNEEGSEAAAATAVVMMTRTALVTRPKSEFVADRPFYFTIRASPPRPTPQEGPADVPQRRAITKNASSDVPGELHAQGTTPRLVIAGALASIVELPPGNRTTEMILRSTVS